MEANTAADQSRQALGAALLGLMRGDEYNKITVLQVCQEAGLSRRTFYRHFQTKEDVLKYMLERVKQDFIAEFGISSITLAEAITHSFTFFYRHRQLLKLFYDHGQFHLVKEILESYMRGACSMERARFLDQPGMEQYFDSYMAGSLGAVLELWAASGFDKPPEELARFALSVNGCVA